MIRVLSVFGTRPEAIKLAPVIKRLGQYPDRILSRVCVTAQHRQMLDQVLRIFSITPDHDLQVMKDNQSPSQVAAAVLARLEPVLEQEQPDWVLVQGDTTTVAAASLAAFYCRVKVGHVEAGLRTHDRWQPFPEEINRRVTGCIADLHFAPVEHARQNLLREGVPDRDITVTGNTVIDALLWAAGLPYNMEQGALAGIPWQRKILMVTAHRRENHGQPMEDICRALREIARRFEDRVHIVYPAHLSPHVQEPVHRILAGIPNITITPPLDYLGLINLMKHSYLVLTDSGGIQEEAPGLGKPVLVLREKTERSEAIRAGTAQLVGADHRQIVSATTRLLEDTSIYGKMASAVNPYGDGHAARRIVETILRIEEKGAEPT